MNLVVAYITASYASAVPSYLIDWQGSLSSAIQLTWEGRLAGALLHPLIAPLQLTLCTWVTLTRGIANFPQGLFPLLVFIAVFALTVAVAESMARSRST